MRAIIKFLIVILIFGVTGCSESVTSKNSENINISDENDISITTEKFKTNPEISTIVSQENEQLRKTREILENANDGSLNELIKTSYPQ